MDCHKDLSSKKFNFEGENNKYPYSKVNQQNSSKKTNKSMLNKKRISSHNKYLANPSITRFNESSHFIYDLDEADRYLSNIKNKNLLKLNQNEISFLENIIFKLDKEKQI